MHARARIIASLVFLAQLCFCAALLPAFAEETSEKKRQDLLELSIEELMDVQVTSASKRPERLADTAAAVFVITQEDIRRSGATNIPEALRLVPGFMVGQANSQAWSVSSRGRGFNPVFENRMLVLVDGRSVYSPIFGGVIWETVDVMMEDVERIEIVRGPGTSAWGSNAINGVVNVITKSAQDTAGGLASQTVGTSKNSITALRYGQKVGENAIRGWAKYSDHGSFQTADGRDAKDEWNIRSGGLRSDWKLGDDLTGTLQADTYDGNIRQTVPLFDVSAAATGAQVNAPNISGGNLLGRVVKEFGSDSRLTAQSFYAREARSQASGNYSIDTYDLDLQYAFRPFTNHLAQLGASYRRYASDLRGGEGSPVLNVETRTDDLWGAFVEDSISFFDNQVILTLGSKFERNNLTGWEPMPSARVLWNVTPEHAVWTAVSRAVRTPTLAETTSEFPVDMRPAPIPFPPFQAQLLTSVRGNHDVTVEKLTAYEAGYRFKPSGRLYVDVAAYYFEYDDVLTANVRGQPAPAFRDGVLFLDNPADAGNEKKATAGGVELFASWLALDWWRLQGWYAWFDSSYRNVSSDPELFDTQYGRISPRHQFSLRSSWDLGEPLGLPWQPQFDALVRYVSELKALGVPDYAELDLRLSVRPLDTLEVALVGQNLLHDGHREVDATGVLGGNVEVPRSAYLQVRYSF